MKQTFQVVAPNTCKNDNGLYLIVSSLVALGH